jgi:hypothetical protein
MQRVVTEVHLHGDTAVTTGTTTLNYTGEDAVRGAASGSIIRFLNVWVKKGGDWKLVARQLTRIEQPQPVR